MGSHTKGLIKTQFFLFVGVAAVLAGLFGDAWYVNDTMEISLWRACETIHGKKNCSRFDMNDMFDSYSGEEYTFDKLDTIQRYGYIITLELFISTGLCGLGALVTLLMACCSSNPTSWKCCALLVAILPFLGACSAFVAACWSEQFRKEFYSSFQVSFSHGWSSILVWVGGVVEFVGSIVAYTMICIPPRRVAEDGRFAFLRTNTGAIIHHQVTNGGFAM